LVFLVVFLVSAAGVLLLIIPVLVSKKNREKIVGLVLLIVTGVTLVIGILSLDTFAEYGRFNFLIHLQIFPALATSLVSLIYFAV